VEQLFTTEVPSGTNFFENGPVTLATTITFAVDGVVKGGQFRAPINPQGTYQYVLYQCSQEDVPMGNGEGFALGTKTAGAMTADSYNSTLFDADIPVVAGQVYKIAIRSDLGSYCATGNFFTGAALTNGNITALESTVFNGSVIPVGSYYNGTYCPNITEYPDQMFNNTCYFVGVLFEADSGLSGAEPTGLAVPVAQGAPTVALGLSTAPAGQAVPVALGSPAVAIPSTAPSGIAVPVALGQPSVGPPATSPSGLAVPVSLGQPSVSNTLVATPSGLAIPVALGQPTVGPAGVQPDGLAIPVATGQPAVALGRVAAPAGLAVPVALGQPSVVAQASVDSPNPPIVASTSGRVIVATSSRPRVVVA
jgi:hypothetical protein